MKLPMTPPPEHDYVGLGEPSPAAEHSDKLSSTAGGEDGGATSDLRVTELRLGLPGAEFSKRACFAGIKLAPPKGSSAGAKRGFYDAIDGAGKWSLAGGSGTEVGLGKGTSGLVKDAGAAAK